jgi:hypothetical protein
MSSPFQNIPILTLPQGFLSSPGGTGTSTQFSAAQASVLATIANSIASVNPNTLTNGTPDIFNTEQYLQGLGTSLQSLVTSLYPLIGVNSTGVSNLLSAFNQGGLLNNSTTPVSILFQVNSGDSFTQFIQAILSISQQPGSFVESTIIGSNGVSPAVPSALWSAYNAVAGGPTGSQAQSLIRPFVNTLFNQSPTTNPGVYDILYSFVGNPTAYIESLFPTSAIYNGVTNQNIIAALIFPPSSPSFPSSLGFNFATVFANLFAKSSSGNSNPYQLVYDMFVNSANVPGDLEAMIAPSFISFFEGLLPTGLGPGLPSNGTNFLGVVKAVFNNPNQVPTTLLNMANLAALPISGVQNLLFGNYLIGILENMNTIPSIGNWFIGQHPSWLGSQFKGFANSVAYQWVPVGTGGAPGAGSCIGWGASVTPGNYGSFNWNNVIPNAGNGPSALNGSFQGSLGAAMALGIASAGSASGALNNLQNWLNNWTSVSSGGVAIENAFDSIYFGTAATIVIVNILSELVSVFANVINALNNSGIPISPTGNVGNFQINNISNFLTQY